MSLVSLNVCILIGNKLRSAILNYFDEFSEKVVECVLKKRLPESINSEIKLGKMNSYLDEMANLRGHANKNSEKGLVHHNHGWRKSLQGGNKNTTGNEEKQSEAALRADWLRRVMSHGLSPLEHKWLVRILQKKVSDL